ncbi:MAG TPA: Ig-like domain-containing protein [Methylocystis sp.]|nr:Ig-like domain-containing protein [Methylocystis sp.]
MARGTRRFVLALAACQLLAVAAMAEDNVVTILSPADGDKVAPGQPLKLDYEVKSGTAAHHVHLYVDDKEAATGHKLKGSFTAEPLKSGAHKLCVAPVNKNHTPIASQACITVTAQ